MKRKQYNVVYTPLFERDLNQVVDYITFVLNNPDAAFNLVDDVEKAILERAAFPESFEPFRSSKTREHPYYRIYVRNYIVYYVVIGDTVEIRRFLYGFRDIPRIL